jgi:hypothetical protein
MKRICSLIVASVMAISLIGNGSAAANSPEKEVQSIEKVKVAILQLGTGKTSLVNITLRDKTKVVGYVSEIRDSSFVVTDLKSAKDTTVSYPDVAQVKGNNLSTRTKIIITAAIIAGVAITLYIVRGAFCDGC